ncbi:hypothetical protein ABDD95_01725 [Mucilaginibacter sp. PAMB04274]|uniref:hypothetical protein n=1 Tax=Mucilaginibacter sp. PAMB04274 TaxID=3138568 RepID=UPI0031F68CD0
METDKIAVNNYVHLQAAGALEICRVLGVGDQITVASINDPFANLQLQPAEVAPIPLTDLWLLELNFTQAPGDQNFAIPTQKKFTRNGITVSLQPTDADVEEITISSEANNNSQTIKYVHELQNYVTSHTSEVLSLP